MSQTGRGSGGLSRRRLWSLRAKYPAAGRFFVIFWKKMTILMRFGSHFERFQSHLKEQNFWDLKVYWTNHSLYFRVKFKTRLKSSILRLNFVIWPKSGKSRYIAFCNFLALNDALKDVPFEDFCFVMKITSFRNICTTRGPGTLDSNSIICSISIFPS